MLGLLGGIGISTFLLLALTFLSSAFMAPAQMPPWMRHIADFNPLDWGGVSTRKGAAPCGIPQGAAPFRTGHAAVAPSCSASIRAFHSRLEACQPSSLWPSRQ
ncbi:ABC transporter permease [Streptomyces sp. HUCO-GS316]|uniref:ABC transporter permease n=1 Tax=Streptomyces sp. HUCO-GS316 TaxID=2692198 RepID=UPI003FA79E22